VIKGALSFMAGMRRMLAHGELRSVLWRMLGLLLVPEVNLLVIPDCVVALSTEDSAAA